VVEAKLHTNGKEVLLRTTDADGFYLLLNRIVLDSGIVVESVSPADDDVNSVYQYLIGGEGAPYEPARATDRCGSPPRNEEDAPFAPRLVGLPAALAPVALTLMHWLVEIARHSGRHSIGEDTLVFAGLFHFYYLRLGIFFAAWVCQQSVPRRDVGEDAALLLPDADPARTPGGGQIHGRADQRGRCCGWPVRRFLSCWSGATSALPTATTSGTDRAWGNWVPTAWWQLWPAWVTARSS